MMTRSPPVQCTYNDGASCSGIHTGRTWTFVCDTMTVHNDDTECASYCDVYQNSKYLSSRNTTKLLTTDLRNPVSKSDDRNRRAVCRTPEERAKIQRKGSLE